MSANKDNRKTFWQAIAPWLDKQYYLFTTTTIFVAALMLYGYFTKPQIKSDSDLLVVNGNFSHYSFVDTVTTRGTLHQFYIWLDNYSNAFQIKADYLNIFKAREFANRVAEKQPLHLTIPKALAEKLNSTNENIFVMSVDTDYENFLDKSKTIEKEKSFLIFYFSIGFLLAGIFYYYIRKNYWKPQSFEDIRI